MIKGPMHSFDGVRHVVIPSVSNQEGLVNGRSGRGPVLDRTVPSRRRRSRGTSLKDALTAHKRELRAIAVVVVLVAAVAFTFVSALGPSSAGSRGPILIQGDAQFDYDSYPDNGVVSGSGSLEDPWVISGWEISGYSTDHGIYIDGTTDYFVIRDVTITGCLNGVYLTYLSNGNVSGNVISDMYGSGIYVEGVCDVLIDSNTISGCDDIGIWVNEDSANVIVTGNALRANSYYEFGAGGIWVRSYDTVTVYSNGFYGNSAPQACDDSYGACSWSQAPPIGGNYWDDYEAVVGSPGVDDEEPYGFWDDPYPIGSAQDTYPLAEDPFGEVIPEFSTVLAPVLLLLAVFLVARRRSSTR